MKKFINLLVLLFCVTGICFSEGYSYGKKDYVQEFLKAVNNPKQSGNIKNIAKEHPDAPISAIKNHLVDSNTIIDGVPLAFYMVFTGDEGNKKAESLRIIKTFIQYGYDINTLDSRHRNILFDATEYYFDEMVDLLIKSGIDVTVQDERKETPLMKACLYGRRNKCAFLLAETKKGLDLVDDRGETALIKAIDKKQFDVAKKLIECGADVNLCEKEVYCPLYQACDRNSIELVKFLVENGADVNKKSGYNDETPLFEAIYPDDYEMVKYLLEKGADPNAKDSENGFTPMFSLDSCKDSRIPEIMIQYGGNINQKNNDGETPFLDVIRFSSKTCINIFTKYKPDYKVLTKEKGNLFHALMDGSLPRTGYGISDSYSFLMGEFEFDEEIIQLLIDNGVDINGKDEKGKTPLMKACSIEFDVPALAEVLIKYGADVNAVDKDKRSSLWYAFRNPKIMKMLLDNGANVKLKDKDKKTPYEYAVGYAEYRPSEEASQCVQLLYEANPKSGKNVSLHAALTSGNVSLSKELLKACKNVNELNEKGESYLICAIKSTNPELVKLVLEKKPELTPYKREEKSDTPLMMAVCKRNAEMVKLLLEYGADPNETGQVLNNWTAYNVSPFYELFLEDIYNRKNQKEIATLLLKYGADPNGIANSNSKDTNFYLAVRVGTTDIVRLFLQYGADPYKNAGDNFYTILEKARREYYLSYDAITEELRNQYVSKNAVTTENLRLRNGSSLNYETLTTIKKNSLVKIIGFNLEKQTIDGIDGYFVEVEVSQNTSDSRGNVVTKGTTGWCFSGYLKLAN